MPFAENLSVFFADFGLACSANGSSFTGILDQPDETLTMVGVNVLSTMYQLTVKTSDATSAGLASNVAITVAGQAYVVRDVLQLDDGQLSSITLSK